MHPSIYDHEKNLRSVSLFNRIAYNWPITHEHNNHNDFMKIVNKQIDLIQSEVDELAENITDSKCCRDDYADIMYTAYGLAYRTNNSKLFLDLLSEASSIDSRSEVDRDNIIATLTGCLRHTANFFRCNNDRSAIKQLVILVNILEDYIYFEEDHTLAQADMEIVCGANLAKFDASVEDAEKTIAKYAAKGIETEYKINTVDAIQYFINVSSHDQTVGGKDYPGDKVLKSHAWKEPVLAE